MVCDAREAIRLARRRAIVRDVLAVILLAAVDYLFAHFPSTHVPGLDRRQSLTLLGAMNGAMLVHLWLARALPRWTARRIAGTWCRTEQQRFFVR